MSDLIDRQAAIEAITEYIEEYNGIDNDGLHDPKWCAMMEARTAIDDLPTAEPRWIPVTERLPEECVEVNITWVNNDPASYYADLKGKPFTGSGVYCKGRWYWYSAVCVDYCKEYGFSPCDEMDEEIKVTAWMPLPEPWKGERDATD